MIFISTMASLCLKHSHPNGLNPQVMMNTWPIYIMANYNSSFVNISHPPSLSKALAPSTLGLSTCWKTSASIYVILLINEWEIILIKNFHQLSQPSPWLSFPPKFLSGPCFNLSCEIHGTLILVLESIIITNRCRMLGYSLTHLNTHLVSSANQLSQHTQPSSTIIVCILLRSLR